jgi:hypothetical protein
MTACENLIAFLAIIIALVLLSALGAFTGKPADLAIMTGLIGVMGTFRPKQASSDTTTPAKDE